MLVTMDYSQVDRATVLRLRDRQDVVEAEDRPVPDVDVDADKFDWPEDAPEGHRIVTTGVTSHVYGGDDETVGHVPMAEYDDVDDPAVAFDAAAALDGLAVVLRSSPRNYHVVDLAVRSGPEGTGFDRALADVEAVDPTPSESYVDEMADQRRFVLRDSAKYRRATADVYKTAPEPVHIAPAPPTSTLLGLSRPHLDVVRDLAASAGRDRLLDDLDAVRSDWRLVGETTTRSTYESMTDELREVLADG